ncbi:MAG: anion transporter, partial [Flavobacteriaceae bacterium]|nr:anion transporter [Flavobacteriaceae bacterium]
MNSYPIFKQIAFLLGPLICLTILVLPEPLLNDPMDKVLAVACWMVLWWISEAVSISVTALLPLALFPLLGIMDISAVASNY